MTSETTPLARARARARESSDVAAAIGHNSNPIHDAAATVLARALDQLDALDQDIAGLNQQKSAVFRDLKSRGYDVAAARRVMKERRVDPLVRHRREQQFSLYWQAVAALGEGGDGQ